MLQEMRNKVAIFGGWGRVAKVVTSLQTNYLHKLGLILCTDAILGHSLYNLGNKFNPVCSYAIFYGSIV